MIGIENDLHSEGPLSNSWTRYVDDTKMNAERCEKRISEFTNYERNQTRQRTQRGKGFLSSVIYREPSHTQRTIPPTKKNDTHSCNNLRIVFSVRRSAEGFIKVKEYIIGGKERMVCNNPSFKT